MSGQVYESSPSGQHLSAGSTSTESEAKAGATTVNDKLEVDPELLSKLDNYAIEDIVELKISRFLDQIGGYYPENLHELIMAKVEKPLVSQILRRVGGNQVHASRILGINRNTLRKKIRLYGL